MLHLGVGVVLHLDVGVELHLGAGVGLHLGAGVGVVLHRVVLTAFLVLSLLCVLF